MLSLVDRKEEARRKESTKEKGEGRINIEDMSPGPLFC
jgi:hypothetical protein